MKRMMNTGIFCKTLLKGGAEKQALVLSKLLTDQKNNVIIITWCDRIDPENLDFIRKNSLKYVPLKGNCLKKFSQLTSTIRENNIKLILSYLTLANVVSGLTRIVKKDLIRVGGIRNEWLPVHKFLFEKWIHNYFNDITVFNNYSARDKFIQRGFKAEKLHVIHNAIAPVRQNGSISRGSSEIRIVTVSRFVRQKDFKTALYSFKELVEANPDKKLVYYIIGYGPDERKIRTLSSSLKLNDRIRVMINPANIRDLLMECNIYLSTSLFEGLSNSIMEAMTAGLPVVATDVGDNRYLVKDGINGYLAACKDVTTITEKLSLLVRSENLRKDFGIRSRSLIETEFSQDNFLKEYLNLFAKLQVSVN